MANADITALFNRALGLGMTREQAAALLGEMRQESQFNPNAYNKEEGAFGGLQWRNDRLDNLKSYANSVGMPYNDLNTQLDFVNWEMNGPEAKAGRAFRNASTIEEANRALKDYIRYGDDSQGTRLRNANNIFSMVTGDASPMPNIVNSARPSNGQVAANTVPMARAASVGPTIDNANVMNATGVNPLVGNNDLSIGDRIGNTLFGADNAARMKSTVSQPNNPLSGGIGLLANAFSKKQEAPVPQAPDMSTGKDSAARMQAAGQLMAQILAGLSGKQSF